MIPLRKQIEYSFLDSLYYTTKESAKFIDANRFILFNEIIKMWPILYHDSKEIFV